VESSQLKRWAIGAEVTVVSTLALSSYNVAFGGAHGVNWMAGAPIATVIALESLRVPTALHIMKAGLLGKVMSAALIVGISVITMEAASLAFENLIFERTRPVAEAELSLKKAEDNQGSLKGTIGERDQERAKTRLDVESARAHRAAVDKPIAQSPPPPPLPPSTQLKPQLLTVPAPVITVQRDKKGRKHTIVTNKAAIDEANQKNQDIQLEAAHGNADAQRTTEEANADAQRKWAEANKAVQDAHDAELKTADAAIAAAQAKLDAVAPDPDMKAAKEAVLEAQRQVEDARASNPMFRVAASWQKKPVSQLSLEEFEAVKHWAIIALAGATAIASALVGIVASYAEAYTGQPSKLNRMLRAWIARRRKPIVVRRDVPGPETIKEVEVLRDVPGPVEYQEKIVYRDVPGPIEYRPAPGPIEYRDVPGPVEYQEKIVYRDVPGPIEYRPAPGPIEYRDVPGPERVVEKVVVKEVIKEVPGPERVVIKLEPYDINTGLRIKADGSLGEVAHLRSVHS
jgi:hypothetical protein